jgi:hypothetical protein
LRNNNQYIEKGPNKLLLFGVAFIVSMVVIPIGFNYLFLWDSGASRGDTSDWFTLFGGILSGLISGFFTYLALLLTLENERKKEKKKLLKEQKRAYISFVLNNKYYFDKIYGEILRIRNITDDTYQDSLIQAAKSINFRESSFEEYGFILDKTKILLFEYKDSLEKIAGQSYEYQHYLKNIFNEFINDSEFYDKTLNFYLQINFLHDDVSSALVNGYYKDLDFLYNFINYDDVGYSSIFRMIESDIDLLWKNHVKDSDSSLSEFMQHSGNSLPHIKG